MMLSEFAENKYSYSGEDGMIRVLCEKLSLSKGFCVEFGASDGIESSNTAALRDDGWSSLLIEADPQKFQMLQSLASDRISCVQAVVAPTGTRSIDALVGDFHVDLMSIDVDGDDYFIFQNMTVRPFIVLVEYNQSVPWFMDVRAANVGNRFGASALSFHRLATEKQYVLVGATETNLVFVAQEMVSHVQDFVEPYSYIMSELPFRCGFIVSDYTCNLTQLNVGNLPKWGWRSTESVDELVVGSFWRERVSPALSERFKRERV